MGFTMKLGKIHYTVNLHSYDAGMKELKKISLDDGKKTLGPFPPYVFVHNQKLEVIYYRYVEDQETMKLFLAQINPADLSVETKELLTIDQKNIGLFESEDALRQIKLFEKFSPDSSKILITNCNDKAIFSCVLDNQLNVTRSTVIKNKNMGRCNRSVGFCRRLCGPVI